MSKTVVDSILSGLYSQAFILQRSSLEAWKRCLYARVRPEDIFRWIPEQWTEELEDLTGFHRKSDQSPSRDDWQIIEARIRHTKDNDLLGLCNIMQRYLHSHVHPSLEGATQIFWGLDRSKPNVSSLYSEAHARSSIRNALLIENLYLSETIHLGRWSTIPRRRIIKFNNGRLHQLLIEIFEEDQRSVAASEAIKPVEVSET